MPRPRIPSWAILLGVSVFFCVTPASAVSKISYDPGDRRDPFVPLSAEAESRTAITPSGLKLEGIIYDPNGRSIAILEGKAYQKGESIGSATLVKILKDSVVISVEGNESTLRLREEEKA